MFRRSMVAGTITLLAGLDKERKSKVSRKHTWTLLTAEVASSFACWAYPCTFAAPSAAAASVFLLKSCSRRFTAPAVVELNCNGAIRKVSNFVHTSFIPVLCSPPRQQHHGISLRSSLPGWRVWYSKPQFLPKRRWFRNGRRSCKSGIRTNISKFGLDLHVLCMRSVRHGKLEKVEILFR